MINYPNGQKTKSFKTYSPSCPKKPTNFAKRGMSFEEDINATNEYYLSQEIAVIHKKPTPIQIVHVDYPARSRAKITEAYFRQASTTDYSGVYKGRYIDFEAKETNQKQSFPLKNFHHHQIEHMKAVLKQEGVAFILLHFSSRLETYYLPASKMVEFYEENKGLKSMPLDFIQKYGFLLPNQQIPRIPYIEIIRNQIGGGLNS
ncbi:Holliday junction resolvase RecU [Lactovum miscens]|uniref:Holliday junction resolvase RecU n=1 Tax=Lactovum miscens TaxID=190387 RepID=A0A841C5G1_9LACT|nr:Holliday junction resolvase RecU [Lactovum miscens]MBB5887507.1 recombination protein U [Lactovum miscens]